MPEQTIDKYLKERYVPEVAWYDAKSKHNQTWAKRYQVTIIVLSVLTPVFAASNIQWATLTSSVLLSITVGILKYYKFEELWQSYRTTCETLRKEKILYESKISPYDKADDPVKMFILRTESMISKENTAWVQIVCKKDKEENKG